MRTLHVHWALVVGLVLGCDAQSCSRLTPLSDGFPASARTANAMQVRISDTGMAALAAQPEIVVAQALGGSLSLDVSSSCGGSSDVCCPGGVPSASCGPLVLDVTAQIGDTARFELVPVQGASRIEATLRARIATDADVPVNVPLAGDCLLAVDSTAGAAEDVTIQAPLSFQQDATAGTTRIVLGSLTLSGLTADDVSLTGSIGCQLATPGLGFFVDTLTQVITDQLATGISAASCQPCTSGDVAECAEFADACTDGVCMKGGECLQQIGLVGRLTGAALHGGAPPAEGGAVDLHEVAGGYATTNTMGAAFGVLGGLLPSGAARERCGPAAPPPSAVVIPQSATFQGNTWTSGAFDIAVGLHASQVEQLAYAAYEGGALCVAFDRSRVPTLTTDALASALPSLEALAGGEAPIAVGLRPQAPPAVAIGANTFDLGGDVDEPVIAVDFTGMEIDLFVQVLDQPIRAATWIADVHLPIGVEIDDAGQLVPVLGSDAAVSNVSVGSSAPLQESTAQVAAAAPALLAPVLEELVRGWGPLALPRIAGMEITPDAVTSVDSNAFVALFGGLAPPPAEMGRLDPAGREAPARGAYATLPHPTRAWLVPLVLALVLALALARWRPARRIRRWAMLAVLAATVSTTPGACGGDSDGGDEDAAAPDAGPLEDGGGLGAPDTGTRFDGGGDAAGTSADAGPDDAGAGEDGGMPCGASACLAGDVAHGALGPWSSVATGARTVVASYDAVLGDLVLVELDGNTRTERVVDGAPDETPTHEPSGYRGGVSSPGPDVGAWTSVLLAGTRVVVAYQDRDRGALRVAFEDTTGAFQAHDVDDSTEAGVEIGAYASLALGSVPSIAYVATGVPDGSNHRTELRLATAKKAQPSARNDWTTSVVAFAAAEPEALPDIPRGPGAFVTLLVLDDGRRVLVHHDRAQGTLTAHVESSAGSGSFAPTLLDGGAGLDRGRWLSAVADDNSVHVAYTDAIGHQVLYLTFTPGGAVGTPEVVDDGTRAGDRPHWVGAGLTLWLDGTTPRVAYQDAATADVVVATRDGVWTHADAATGATLDGFHLAAPAKGAGPLVWDRVGTGSESPHALIVVASP